MKTRCPNCSCFLEIPEIQTDPIDCPSCGSRIDFLGSDTETASLPEREPVLMKHFELKECVGKGQFGSVWKAKDTRLDRIVAVKVPHRAATTRKEIALTINEAQAAAQLTHPNIVQIYEVFRGDSVCIVSQFIDGVSLKQRVRELKGNYQEIASIGKSICSGLAHAHERGVIHRDLKPANILLDLDGVPHITDFGLAKRDGSTMTVALEGQVLGTPAYMSPQQALGKSDLVDGRADVYSVGIILYELLTGKRPFEGDSHTLLYSVVHDDLPDPRKLNPNCPVDLANICLKAAEKKPEDRYQSAQEMEADLERYLHGEPILAQPWPWTRKAKRFLRSNVAALVIASLAMLLVGAISWSLVPKRPSWWGTATEITITTEPPGAEVIFFEVDPQTLLPKQRIESTHRLGKSPIKTRLPAGDYIAVAFAEDGTFHSVLRKVPQNSSSLPHLIYAHRSWKRASGEEAYALPEITLFPTKPILDNFNYVKGGDFSTQIEGPSQTYRVPDFWLMRSKLTLADIEKTKNQPAITFAYDAIERQKRLRLPKAESLEIAQSNALAELNYDDSVMLCELLGLQLPHMVLWEYASKSSLAQPEAWDGLSAGPPEWTSPSRIRNGYITAMNFGQTPMLFPSHSSGIAIRPMRYTEPPKSVEALLFETDQKTSQDN